MEDKFFLSLAKTFLDPDQHEKWDPDQHEKWDPDQHEKRDPDPHLNVQSKSLRQSSNISRILSDFDSRSFRI